MKTTTTLKSITLIALLGAALAAPVLAQGGGGMGGGPGMQNGGGPGAGGGRGMQFSQNNTRGWTLMTPEERTAFQTQMHSAKTYDECKVIQTSHRTAMEERAKEKGVTLAVPRQNGCDVMKSRGLIK